MAFTTNGNGNSNGWGNDNGSGPVGGGEGNSNCPAGGGGRWGSGNGSGSTGHVIDWRLRVTAAAAAEAAAAVAAAVAVAEAAAAVAAGAAAAAGGQGPPPYNPFIMVRHPTWGLTRKCILCDRWATPGCGHDTSDKHIRWMGYQEELLAHDWEQAHLAAGRRPALEAAPVPAPPPGIPQAGAVGPPGPPPLPTIDSVLSDAMKAFIKLEIAKQLAALPASGVAAPAAMVEPDE
jgi:hypothetical protein